RSHEFLRGIRGRCRRESGVSAIYANFCFQFLASGKPCGPSLAETFLVVFFACRRFLKPAAHWGVYGDASCITPTLWAMSLFPFDGVSYASRVNSPAYFCRLDSR